MSLELEIDFLRFLLNCGIYHMKIWNGWNHHKPDETLLLTLSQLYLPGLVLDLPGRSQRLAGIKGVHPLFSLRWSISRCHGRLPTTKWKAEHDYAENPGWHALTLSSTFPSIDCLFILVLIPDLAVLEHVGPCLHSILLLWVISEFYLAWRPESVIANWEISIEHLWCSYSSSRVFLF